MFDNKTQRLPHLFAFAILISSVLPTSFTAGTFSARSSFWAVLFHFSQCWRRMYIFCSMASEIISPLLVIKTWIDGLALFLQIGVHSPDLFVPSSTSGSLSVLNAQAVLFRIPQRSWVFNSRTEDKMKCSQIWPRDYRCGRVSLLVLTEVKSRRRQKKAGVIKSFKKICAKKAWKGCFPFVRLSLGVEVMKGGLMWDKLTSIRYHAPAVRHCFYWNQYS